MRCWASAWDTTRRPTKADPGGGKEAGGCRVRARSCRLQRAAAGPRTARTPRHRYRMRRWTRSSHQTKPTFGGTDDWNPIPTTHSRCHSGRRSKTHILKLSIKPPTAMQKAPVRTSSSESFGSFILRRATRTDARVRSSGYKQAHEKRMQDARQGCDRSCCARLLRAVRVGAHQHLRPRRLLLLLPRVAGFCSDRARLGRCWPRILLRHPLHILVAFARGHAGEPIFRLVAAAAALRRCALGLRARRRQPRSQNAHDQPRARSSEHRQIGKAHFCRLCVEKVMSFTLKRPRETNHAIESNQVVQSLGFTDD